MHQTSDKKWFFKDYFKSLHFMPLFHQKKRSHRSEFIQPSLLLYNIKSISIFQPILNMPSFENDKMLKSSPLHTLTSS